MNSISTYPAYVLEGYRGLGQSGPTITQETGEQAKAFQWCSTGLVTATTGAIALVGLNTLALIQVGND